MVAKHQESFGAKLARPAFAARGQCPAIRAVFAAVAGKAWSVLVVMSGEGLSRIAALANDPRAAAKRKVASRRVSA
jgi:hypothetical protein